MVSRMQTAHIQHINRSMCAFTPHALYFVLVKRIFHFHVALPRPNFNLLLHYSFPLQPPGFQQMILQQHTRQWYDLLTILLTRWHGKVLKLCLLVDFLLKLLARISLVLSLEEEDHSQLQGDTTVNCKWLTELKLNGVTVGNSDEIEF